MTSLLSEQEIKNLKIKIKYIDEALEEKNKNLKKAKEKRGTIQGKYEILINTNLQLEKQISLLENKKDRIKKNNEKLENRLNDLKETADEIVEKEKEKKHLKKGIQEMEEVKIQPLDNRIEILKKEIAKLKNKYARQCSELNKNYFGQMVSKVVSNFKAYSALFYLIISALGLTYSVIYYNEYDIKILYYSSLIDFFLMGLKKQVFILVFLFASLFFIFWMYSQLKTYAVQKKVKRDFEFWIGPKIFAITMCFLFVSVSVLAIRDYKYQTHIKKVSIFNTPPIRELKKAYEIGQTTDYIFLIKEKESKTEIIIPKSKIMAAENYHLDDELEYIKKSYTTFNVAETFANWKLIHQINSMLASNSKTQQDASILLQKILEASLSKELRKHCKEEITDECRLKISPPIVFLPNIGDFKNNRADEIKYRESIEKFFSDISNSKKSIHKLYVVGLASPDGKKDVNKKLSENRANSVIALINNNKRVQEYLKEKPIPLCLGEDHQINGLSDSRSVYLAATMPQ